MSDHPGAAARRRLHPDHICICGRVIMPRADGQRRKHRTDADNPVSAYCPGGAA